MTSVVILSLFCHRVCGFYFVAGVFEFGDSSFVAGIVEFGGSSSCFIDSVVDSNFFSEISLVLYDLARFGIRLVCRV